MKLNGIAPAMAAAVLSLAASDPAAALAVAEVEPNDTLAGAQQIHTDDALIAVAGQRTFANPSDDFYAFQVRGPGLLTISSSSLDLAADSIMGLFGPGGALLASNDDTGPSLMSSISYDVPVGMTGWYTVGFSGFNAGLIACTDEITACYDTDGDFVFDTFVAGGGAGGSTGWDYALDIGGAALVPEPAAYGLMALGLAVLALRRPRRQRP
jgi:hypothetical protein